MQVEECIEKYSDVLKVVEYLIEARLTNEEEVRRAFIGTSKCLWDLAYEKNLINKDEHRKIEGAFIEMLRILEGKLRDRKRLDDVLRRTSNELLKLISTKCATL